MRGFKGDGTSAVRLSPRTKSTAVRSITIHCPETVVLCAGRLTSTEPTSDASGLGADFALQTVRSRLIFPCLGEDIVSDAPVPDEEHARDESVPNKDELLSDALSVFIAQAVACVGSGHGTIPQRIRFLIPAHT